MNGLIIGHDLQSLVDSSAFGEMCSIQPRSTPYGVSTEMHWRFQSTLATFSMRHVADVHGLGTTDPNVIFHSGGELIPA